MIISEENNTLIMYSRYALKEKVEPGQKRDFLKSFRASENTPYQITINADLLNPDSAQELATSFANDSASIVCVRDSHPCTVDFQQSTAAEMMPKVWADRILTKLKSVFNEEEVEDIISFHGMKPSAHGDVSDKIAPIFMGPGSERRSTT